MYNMKIDSKPTLIKDGQKVRPLCFVRAGCVMSINTMLIELNKFSSVELN